MTTNPRFLNKPKLDLLVLLLLLMLAFGIRLHNITKPPLDFSPIRQYQNAHIARGLYYETNDLISESKKQIAELNMKRMGFVLEPRIIENIAVLGYRIMGAEHLWIPRLVSSIFWIIGGIFLFLIAKEKFSSGVAMFSAFFYLFLPYSILSSRSFQPDPLMVMMMLFSIYLVLRYDKNSTKINLVSAAIIAALAILIKPYCIFIIFGAFFPLVVLRVGFWKASFHRDTIIYILIIIVPTIFYYGYGLLTDVGFLGEHASGSFLPHLLFYPSFWREWLVMIGLVVGYIPFFLAFLGVLRMEKSPKAMILGLWAGYFLFGLSATYQIHTHSYYTMPFIPIIALSLAPLAATVMDCCTALLSTRTRRVTLMVVFLLITLGLGMGVNKLPLKKIISDYKSELKTVAAFIGVNPQFRKFLVNDFSNEMRIAKEIGEHVVHSTNTVFLTPFYGRFIAYYGELAGLPWPTKQSLYGRSLRGTKVPDIKEDLTPEHIVILYHGKFIEYTPDFFIVTALNEFENQSDLKKYLTSNFPIFVQNNDYVIFDMRKMSE